VNLNAKTVEITRNPKTIFLFPYLQKVDFVEFKIEDTTVDVMID